MYLAVRSPSPDSLFFFRFKRQMGQIGGVKNSFLRCCGHTSSASKSNRLRNVASPFSCYLFNGTQRFHLAGGANSEPLYSMPPSVCAWGHPQVPCEGQRPVYPQPHCTLAIMEAEQKQTHSGGTVHSSCDTQPGHLYEVRLNPALMGCILKK